MRRLERQVICQPARRRDGLYLPRSQRPRSTRGGTRLEPRARQQRHTEAALHGGFMPGPRSLPRPRAWGDVASGLTRPAVGLRSAELGGGPLPRGRAAQEASKNYFEFFCILTFALRGQCTEDPLWPLAMFISANAPTVGLVQTTPSRSSTTR
jgi:hypothetical protein